VQLEQQSTGEEVSPASHFGPGMGLLFLFLSLAMVSRGIIIERQTKVLDRMRAAPVSGAAILLGKTIPVVLTSIASLCTIWAATTLLLGADWGDPIGVVLLILGSAIAVAGMAALLASWARTEQAAGLAASFVAFVLSLVGGNMLPLADMPDVMQKAARATPNGWALLGFAELSAGDGGVGEIVPHLVILLAFGAVLGLVGLGLVRRRLFAR
jgi:ABC-2 type transport system permease protein